MRMATFNERVSARNRLKTGEVDANDVTHMDASRKQIIGSSAGLIPFIEKNYVYRSLMGSNQQRQAVPLIKPQAPIVGTGLEGAVAENSGQMILAEDAGEVTRATASEVVVKYKSGTVKYEPLHYIRSNEGTSINQKVAVNSGQKVKKGDVLVEGMSISNGELALGKDLFVAFMPWHGYNFEDAIVISRRLVEDDTLTSVHIVDYMTEVRETKLGPEIVTRDIPNVSQKMPFVTSMKTVLFVSAQKYILEISWLVRLRLRVNKNFQVKSDCSEQSSAKRPKKFVIPHSA
jgi:DNA-directed RNA polymerase subunit beta